MCGKIIEQKKTMLPITGFPDRKDLKEDISIEKKDPRRKQDRSKSKMIICTY